MGCLLAHLVTAMLSMYPSENAQGSFCHCTSHGLVLGARDSTVWRPPSAYSDMPSGCF